MAHFIIIHDHPIRIPRCTFCDVTSDNTTASHVTSSKVTKRFLPKTYHRNQAQAAIHVVSLCSANQDLGSTIDLDLIISPLITYIAEYRRVNFNGRESGTYYCFCSSSISSKVIGNKFLCPPEPLLWLFRPLWRHFWHDLKKTHVKIADLARLYPMLFTRLSLARFFFEIWEETAHIRNTCIF